MASKRRSWLVIVAAAAAITAVAARPSAQQRLTIGNAGGSLAAAERVAFYTPFADANHLRIQEDSFNQELAKLRLQVERRQPDVGSGEPHGHQPGYRL